MTTNNQENHNKFLLSLFGLEDDEYSISQTNDSFFINFIDDKYPINIHFHIGNATSFVSLDKMIDFDTEEDLFTYLDNLKSMFKKIIDSFKKDCILDNVYNLNISKHILEKTKREEEQIIYSLSLKHSISYSNNNHIFSASFIHFSIYLYNRFSVTLSVDDFIFILKYFGDFIKEQNYLDDSSKIENLLYFKNNKLTQDSKDLILLNFEF